MAYRWFAAWLPLFAVFMVLLGGLWFYVSFIQPPALKDQWTKIENKWAPARAAAWAKLDKAAKTSPFDLAAYQAAAADYETQLTGWLDEVLPSGRNASYWGAASSAVTQFHDDITSMNQNLDKVKAAKTIFEMLGVEPSLFNFDNSINNDVYGQAGIRISLGLSLPSVAPSTIPFPSISPSPSPQPSGSPGASGSPGVTPSPAPSPSPTAS